MTNILMSVGIVTLIFAAFFWRMVWAMYGLGRQRALAEARADLAYCAASIQKHMANGTVKHGELVHDLFCRFMNEAQYMDRYISLSVLLTDPSERQQFSKVREQLDRELSQLPNDMAQLAKNFQVAYVKAALYRHPVQVAVFVFWTVARRGIKSLREAVVGLARSDFSYLAVPGRLAAAVISLGIVLTASGPADQGFRVRHPNNSEVAA